LGCRACVRGRSCGAGGPIGPAVAKAFAAEGAEVFLAGRGEEGLKAAATQIAAAGGRARPGVIDALDEPAVEAYLRPVAQEAGRIDIEFNATGPRAGEYATPTPAAGRPADLFMVPVTTTLTSNYITARAAARQMVNQGTGVIMFLTGSPARPHAPAVTAMGAAFGAIENLTRTMAIEPGPRRRQGRLPPHRADPGLAHKPGERRTPRPDDGAS